MFRSIVYAILLLCMQVFAEDLLILKDIQVSEPVSKDIGVDITLRFNRQPSGVPIYAMDDPERIVVDLVDTRIEDAVSVIKTGGALIDTMYLVQKEINGRPNISIHIGVKHTVYYRAYLSGTELTLSFSTPADSAVPTSVYSATKTNSVYNSLKSIDVIPLQGRIQVNADFTDVPGTASIYLLENPPRIVMDFFEVYLDEEITSVPAVFPVNRIAVKQLTKTPPSTSVLMYLDKKTTFNYRHVGTSIVVDVFLPQKNMTKKNMLALIGTGVVLVGGTATGILLNSGNDKGPVSDDLGVPPDFPE